MPLVFLSYLTQPNAPRVRFGAETDRWGNERVGLTPVKAWLKYRDEGERLVRECDALMEKLRKEENRVGEFETASEKM